MKTALVTGIYGQDGAFIRPQHPKCLAKYKQCRKAKDKLGWQTTATFDQLSEMMMMTADLRRAERKCD